MPKEAFFKLSEEKQTRILDAALVEFIEYKNNYDKASVKRIAEKANIAIGSIYKYFEDKNDLFFHVFERSKPEPRLIPESGTLRDYANELLEISSEENSSETYQILSDIIYSERNLFHSLIFDDVMSSRVGDNVRLYLSKDRERKLLREQIDDDIATYMYFALEYLTYDYCQKHGLDTSQEDEITKKFSDIFFYGIYHQDQSTEEEK